MSSTIILEISNSGSLEDVRNALVGLAYSKLSEDMNGFSAFLDNTNASMSVKTHLQHTSVLAEGLDNINWLVGLRVYFDVDGTLPDPFADVKKIISNLAEQTKIEFVLSFQYETVYAIRDSSGLSVNSNF